MTLPKRLIYAGAGIFITGLILQFPARIAYHWAAPEQLRLSGISGTVWHGRATEGMVGEVYLRNLRWRFRPLALIGGKLGAALSADPASGFLDTKIAVSATGALILNDLNGTVSLQAFEDSFQLKGFRGDLNLQLSELVVRDGIPVRASGSVGLSGLAAPQLTNEPIGDFRVEFQTDDSGIVGSVENVSGMLQVAGVIKLSVDRAYSFVGQVATTPQAPESIKTQLQLLGSADARGQREFRIEGRL